MNRVEIDLARLGRRSRSRSRRIRSVGEIAFEFRGERDGSVPVPFDDQPVEDELVQITAMTTRRRLSAGVFLSHQRSFGLGKADKLGRGSESQ